MSQKYFYLHIPKTAGTTFNDFLERAFGAKETIFHIESKIDKIHNQRVIAGHLQLPKAEKLIDEFENYIQLTVLREPLKQLSSHLRYVKKLGEPSEKKRLAGHTESIKRIVAFLQGIDFSKVEDLKVMIEWLEKENYILFHNCQTHYLLGSRFHVNQTQVDFAIKKLQAMKYVGITERLNDFMYLLGNEFEFTNTIGNKKLNVTTENYGLDIQNSNIVEVLEPLICYDKIIYEEAKKRFEKDFSLLGGTLVQKENYYFDKIKSIFKF